jgi:ribokinase
MSLSKIICVIGSSNTDMVIKVNKLPSPGETVMGGSFLMNPGGKGANQAVAASRLDGQVVFATKVGNDVFGKQAKNQFQREKIDVKYITTDNDHPSGIALINVDSNGENCITVAPGANSELKPKDVESILEDLKPGALVLLQLEIPINTVDYAIRRSFKKGLHVVLNPAPAQILPADLFPCLYLITPNETEAELLTGITITDVEKARQAAIILREKGVPNVIITLGAKGAYIHTDSISTLVPAPPVTAIDTTAAGDCFNGALCVAIAENQPIDQAVAFACKAASICVTRMGAQASLPSRKEVNDSSLIQKIDLQQSIQLI